jgi:hypothetical protein
MHACVMVCFSCCAMSQRIGSDRIGSDRIGCAAQYGMKKRCMFHDSRFLARIEATAGCRHASLPSGHWFMIDHAQETLGLIHAFLAAEDATGTPGTSTSGGGAGAGADGKKEKKHGGKK